MIQAPAAADGLKSPATIRTASICSKLVTSPVAPNVMASASMITAHVFFTPILSETYPPISWPTTPARYWHDMMVPTQVGPPPCWKTNQPRLKDPRFPLELNHPL